uniref:Uncharacterized protein n=1 Tax=Anguilla anguilla TaxID=7936 RepID=A0A0E9PP85_ANGAN
MLARSSVTTFSHIKNYYTLHPCFHSHEVFTLMYVAPFSVALY